MAINFPDSPSNGSQWVVSANGYMYLYDPQSSWTTKGDTVTTTNSSGATVQTNPFSNVFKYRTIYTHGYTSCGYKDGSPWRNSNKTIHSTDVTNNLGDILDYGASYKSGGFSDYYHYIYGMTNTHNGGSSYVGSLNMSTDANRTHDSAWDLKTSRGDGEVILNSTLTLAYYVGGGSTAVDKHNLVTETMYAAGSAPDSGLAGGDNSGISAFYGEFRGYCGQSSSAVNYMTWATESWTSTGSAMGWGTGGQPKGLSSKWGYGYCAEGGYAGTNYMKKFSDTTTSTSVASLSRPETCGEENCQMGQNWGYTIGSYNGAAQTNNTTKIYYTTDTISNMGSDTMPKGHDGMSSGCCGTASSRITAGGL